MSEAESRHLEGLLEQLRDLVEAARTMPMSASVLVNRDEAVELINRALGSLPAELRHARWLLKERQEYLVREARRAAQQVIADAEAEARRLHHAAEDYVDARLAALEGLLDKTMTGVRKGRDRLAVELPPEEEDHDAAEEREEIPVFDQDEARQPGKAP